MVDHLAHTSVPSCGMLGRHYSPLAAHPWSCASKLIVLLPSLLPWQDAATSTAGPAVSIKHAPSYSSYIGSRVALWIRLVGFTTQAWYLVQWGSPCKPGTGNLPHEPHLCVFIAPMETAPGVLMIRRTPSLQDGEVALCSAHRRAFLCAIPRGSLHRQQCHQEEGSLQG